MSDENYLNPDELVAVADYCTSIAPLWDVLTSCPKSGITVEMVGHFELSVYDSNGDTLGRIMWGEDGAAFYPRKSATDGD